MGLATNITGIIGTIISLAILLTPAPTSYGILNKNEVEEVQVDPYLSLVLSPFTLMNCYVWIIYGSLVENIFVFIINFVGVVVVPLFVRVYAPFASDSKKRILGHVLLFELVLVMIIVLVAALCFRRHSVVFVGIIADASSAVVYASHLAIWRKVITTKSVEYVHFWLSLAVLSNGICWTIYAILQFDIFILVSSGVGAIFGAIELSLCAYFYFNGKKKVTPSEESSDIHANEAA